MRNSGFTLIELLVVIGIIGILSGMSVAQYKGVIARARTAKAIAFESQVDRQLLAEMTSNQLKMVARYDFEEFDAYQFKDLSGNGPNLVVSTTTEQRSVDVPYGTGHSFNALNRKAAIGINASTPRDSEEGAISFWAKLSSSLDDEWLLLVDNAASRGFEIDGLANGNLLFRVEGAVSDSPAYKNLTTSGLSLRESGWHHFLGSYDGNKMSLFVDGEFQGETPYSVFLGDFGKRITLNYGQDAALFDNLRIYPVAYKP